MFESPPTRAQLACFGVRRWTIEKEASSASPYDLHSDSRGVYQWSARAADFAQSHPVTIEPAQTEDEFCAVIELIIAQYKLFVEEQGGWRLLWNDNPVKDKPESAAQLLFRGLAENYCRANNIVVDREVELGRGPVDFKFSNGYTRRAHIELKKLHNGKFWNGLEQQLPSYMRSDDVKHGWYLALHYRDNALAKERRRLLPRRVRTVAEERDLNLRFQYVDARPKESASKL